MCSVSLIRDHDSLVVTMNRDERRERHEAGLYVDDLQIHPIDSYAGGTWCGVNRFGLLATILNRYQDQQKSDGTVSRGTLIPFILKENTLSNAAQSFTALTLEKFNPFTLMLADQRQAEVWEWDGLNLKTEAPSVAPCLFYSSSSVDALSITQERSAMLKNAVGDMHRGGVNTAKVLSAHLARSNTTHSRAIFMDREISHTKSIVQMRLNHSHAQFDYYNESALEPVRDGSRELPLISDHASLEIESV